ncbi:predicted protein [Naegleria gruberi]|uniref:Predicted protein n=1 Tax=Naegleria gruberi TaxID=5762 RepID=D2UYW6_NAEGR|nr:uncharacterized protein NAEGRDRAFT_45339 [Naegleria gruberi]EFC50043.1 predicted protein [Naegleria gruberi]|eukprot:XP_002682787.1 predicted protein [Naegleria gruberi strain NEG-M]
MFTEYNDRHSNFVVLVICYEHKATIIDAKKATKNNSSNSGVAKSFNDKATNGKTNNSNEVKIVRKWNEFRLPLNENQVLQWSQLPNNSELKFYHVPTFKHCIENGINFVNYENHVINDSQVLGKEQLQKKDCYFVFTSDSYSIDFDPKKEELKTKLISNFCDLFEIDTDTSLFYLEASDYDINLAVKNYCASQRSKSLEDLFLLHSKNGKADLISLLLNVEFDKTCKNNIGMTALHLAVRYEHLDCVKLLLQSKLKNQLNEKDGIANLPIHLASMGNSVPIFELLLKETRDITLKNMEKETILHTLCKGQANVEIFDLLFAKICEHFDEDFTKYSKFFNLLNDDGESAVLIAVRKNHFHLVQHIVNSQLFSSLFNFNLKNKLSQSILVVACKEDSVQTLQILLPVYNQMIMERDERSFTPLHYATLFNSLAASSLLLQYLDIQQYDTVLFHGTITPLQYAVSQNNIELLRLHLNYLTNNNSLSTNSNLNNSLNHALFLCIKQHRSIELVKEILQYQVDINQNMEGPYEYIIPETTTPKFPLVDCVLNDSKTIFKFLIRQPNINVNQQSKETGMTCLQYAIIKHYLKPTEHSKYFIMKLIKKTNLSIQDHFLRTALHLSKLCEFKDISESIEALNESRYIKDLNDIPCKDYTKESSFASNLLFEKYCKYVTQMQAHAVNYKLFHGVYLQHEILNFLYNAKLSVNDLQSIYKRISYFQKYLPSVHFIKHINLPIFPQLLNFKYENNNLHLVYSSNTLFEQTSSCRFYLDNNLLTHPIHQFSTMLKIISSIYVLHYSNITHGNIKPNSFRFVNDTKLLYVYDYGLLFNQLDEKQSSPEIKACKNNSNGSINDILSKKSNDIFNLGHVLHEVLFGSKYGEKDFSVTSIVQQLYSTIMACFTDNEEFRPDIKELYDAIRTTIHTLIGMLKESASKQDPAKILEMELKLVDVMISRYGYNDHTKPHEMNATQNIGKCISKINELVKTEQLSILNVFNQMPEHLDNNTIKQLFSTIHYLIQVLNDKFKAAAFDLLRVLLLKKECVEYLLTHHENLTLVDILDRMKNVNNVDGFTLTLISSCLAHCLIHPIGLNYFTNHLDKHNLISHSLKSQKPVNVILVPYWKIV